MDLGDKKNVVFVIDQFGHMLKSCEVDNTREALTTFFTTYKESTVAIEAGTHSPWISRLLTLLGCNVLVGNPRKLRAIWADNDKSDVRDAEMLARIARFDPQLLYSINHRNEQAQIDLQILQSRDLLVSNRTKMINHIRSSIKSLGGRIPPCSSESFHKQAIEHMVANVKESLQPLIDIVEQHTEQIKQFDKWIERVCDDRYQETELLRAVKGVGPLTALAYVLIVEDPGKFRKSRQLGKYLGLSPRRDQSGELDKQLRITKAGNPYLRRLLVSAGQYILGPFGEDCNLRRFGLRLAQRGGKNAKRRAVVAVARKLSVLLHRLWLHGEVYDPFYKVTQSKSQLAMAA
jgi:transposase